MIEIKDLYNWCKIPYSELESHSDRKIPFRLVKDSDEMGQLMAQELALVVRENIKLSKTTRAIIPCGPNCWYKPFTELVNSKCLSLRNMIVFHMDECLDWQGHELPRKHPYSFRGFMERKFYDPISPELRVPDKNRYWLNANNIEDVRREFYIHPIDIAFGGWGQDGHIAYNQARRHPYSHISIDELRHSSIRIQENNLDTILALSHRTFGGAYQFVPPMSVTLGLKECLSARKVRLFSDTGAWKQTALRVALFGPITEEYPITLLQEHHDALLTATIETAHHPISENPEWDFGFGK